MPTYAVTVEDAQYQVDAPDENTAWQWAYMTHQQRPAPKQSTVLSELKRGFKQFGSSTQTGLEALTSPEEAAKAGVERAQRIAEEAGEGVSFAPVREAYEKQGILSALGEAASQVPRAVAGMLPAAAATVAGGKAGALAGTVAAPALGPFAPAGPVVGGLLGAGAALYGSMAGSNIERQAQEQMEAGKPVSIDRPAAYGAAVGQTALEAVGTGAVLGKRLVKGVLGIADDAALATAQARQALIKEAQRSMLGATGMGAVRGAAEIPVEIAQAVLERAQAGLDVLSPDAYDEYGATAYQAALGGAGLGALTGVPSRGQARAELAQIQPTPEQTARQEAQQRILAAQAAPRGFTKKGKGGQGLLFTPEELEGLKKPEEETPAAAAPEAAPTPEAPQPEQLTLGFPTAESPAAAQQELDLLKKQKKTPEVKSRMEELKGFIRAAEEQARAEAPKGYTKEGQGRLFTPAEMRASGLKRMREPTEAEPTPPTPGQLRQAGQKQLKFTAPVEASKRAPAVESVSSGTVGITQEELTAPTPEVTEAVPEPTLAPKRAVPPELQPVLDKLTAAGVRPEVQTWAENAKNRPFLRKLMGMADMAPEAAPQARKALKLKEGSEKAEIFDALFPTPGVPAFEPAPGAGESRLGLLGQLGAVTPPAAPAPRARKPVGRGVVPAGGVAPAAAPAEGKPAPALEPTPKAYPSLPRAEQYWNDTAAAVGGKAKPFSELTPAQRGAWRTAVQAEDAQTLREEYARIAGEKDKAEEIRAREAAAAKKAEAERVKAEREAEAKRKAEEVAARERAKRETERVKAEQEAEAKRKAEEAEAKRKAEEAEAKRKAEEAKAKELPPYEERVKLGKDDLYPKLKDFDSAVAAIYDQASNSAERTIASLIKSRVEQFKKLGFDFSLRVTPEGKMLSSGALGHSHIKYSHIGEATKVAVALNHPSNGELSGTSWRIVTHELLHAVTQAQIKFAPEGATAKKLKALFNDVVEYFNARAKAKTLTAFETRIYNGEINALQKPDELLTWGLTDKDMQAWLNGIESKKGNFLSRLYDVVASVLGFSKPNTALAELLSVSETLLTEPTDAYVKHANLRGASFGLQENVSDVPNWALGFAEGRPVVWFENDAALIKAETFRGEPIYLLATPDGISRVDVSGFTGKLLSPERLAEVQAIAEYERLAKAQTSEDTDLQRKAKRPAEDSLSLRGEEEPPLFESISTLTREPSVYGDEVQRSPSLSRTIAALRRRLDEGKLTPEEFAVRVERAHDAYKRAQEEKARKPRERGADYIRERLLGAKRRGEFDAQEVGLAEWFIGKNPALLDDLAISIAKPEAESAAAGKYDPLYRLMTLFKDAEADGTIVHEILHHLERMMPAEVQAGIRKAWLVSLERASAAAQRGTDPALKEFYQNLQAFHTSETGSIKDFTAAVKAIKDGKVSKDHYQHVNPSEFWAENGTAIVQRRFAASNSIVARLKQWLSELAQKLKSVFGLSSNAPIIRALDSLAKADGKFVSDTMLMEGVPLYSLSPTEGIAAQSELMKDAPSSLKKSLSDMLRIVGEKDDVPFTTRFRVEVADVAASVVNRLNILFDGKVRDEITGLTNPELLIRQAQATEALFNGFLASGGIEKDPATGQYIVTDKPGPGGSVADMLAAIKNWSDAKGMDFKLGYAEASKMLEARRLDAMRQENAERKKKGQDLFPIHKLALDDKRDADEQIDAALRGLKANPDIQKVADMMDQQRAYMIDKMVTVGRISKDTAQEWKDAAGYVPFDRVEDFFEKYVPKRTSGRGLAQLGSLPQFVGTTQREVGNVFDNHTKLMGWMLKQTLKQDATFTTMNVLADLGMATRLYGNQAAATNKNNVVATYKNGQKQYFEVRSHWDAVAFRDAPEVKATIWKVFAAVSNILRKIVTVMPPFVAKQVTDDIQRAFITSGVREPSKLIVPAVTNFLRIAGHELVFGKDHPFTKEFAKKGLVGDIDYNASNPAETVLFSMGYSKRGWLSALHHRLESVTRASDLAMRKAIYDRTMKEENEDVGLATARAREFINFRRRGASKTVGMAIATIPFFNAYLQSNDLLYRSMIGRGSSTTERAVAKRLFWTQAAKMTTFALIYALANSDDEEYDKLSFEEKANNWVVDGKKLPAPGDMAALFKVPVEALVHYMSRQGTKEEQLTSEVVKQVLGYTYEQFVGRVTPVPQAIRPVFEALTNYSFLTLRPLVGTYQKGLPEEFQTVSTTSELAKAIAKFSHNNIVDPITDTPLDLSPIVIDNTLRGYLGGVVPLMNMLIDQMVNPNKTDRPLSKYWFIGQYLTPEVPSGPKDEFYDLVNRVMPVKRALDKLANTDIDAAMKYYEKNADKLKMAELVNTALQTVRQTRQYINWLDSAEGAKAIESSAERLKLKQEAERYLNDHLSWVRAAKAQIFGNKD